jgi:rod shape-determining protein MreB
VIGEQTAEHLKKTIGTASRDVPCERMRATGAASTTACRARSNSPITIADALAMPLKQVIGAIKTALENAPPELVTDIAHAGIVLTGGGALLANLDRRLREETGLAVRVADEPLTCGVRGMGAAAGLLHADAFE